MSAKTANPAGREHLGTREMEGHHQGSGMHADGTPHLRNPFPDEQSPSGDYGILDPQSPTQEETERRKSSGAESPNRRQSKEWDAAKVPPSRFQKREGSIFSTGSSRDSHITRKDRDAPYHAKLKEKGWD